MNKRVRVPRTFLILLAVVVFAVTCRDALVFAEHSEPEGVQLPKGMLKWGKSVDDAKTLSADPARSIECLADKRADVSNCFLMNGVDLGSGLTAVALVFHKDRFFAWTTGFNESRFDSIAKRFTERLGAPSKNAIGVVQNRFGASFDQHVLGWESHNVSTRLSRRGHGGSVDKGGVLMIYKPIDSEIPKPAVKVPF